MCLYLDPLLLITPLPPISKNFLHSILPLGLTNMNPHWPLLSLLAVLLPPSAHSIVTFKPINGGTSLTVIASAADIGAPAAMVWVNGPGYPWIALGGPDGTYGPGNPAPPIECPADRLSAQNTIANYISRTYPRITTTILRVSLSVTCPHRTKPIGYWQVTLNGAAEIHYEPPVVVPSCAITVPPNLQVGQQPGTFQSYRSITGVVTCTSPSNVRVNFSSNGSSIVLSPTISGDLQVNKKIGSARFRVTNQSNVEIGVDLRGTNAPAGAYSKSGVVTMTIE